MVVGGLMIAILALMLIFLQQQFNQGDYRRALELVAAPKPGEKWSIVQELTERSKDGAPDCRPKLVSSFRGIVEVTCYAGQPSPYRFEVDLVRRSVQPTDAASRELMEAAQAKNRAIGAQPGGAGSARDQRPDAGR
jgi:hypothetical protein